MTWSQLYLGFCASVRKPHINLSGPGPGSGIMGLQVLEGQCKRDTVPCGGLDFKTCLVDLDLLEESFYRSLNEFQALAGA